MRGLVLILVVLGVPVLSDNVTAELSEGDLSGVNSAVNSVVNITSTSLHHPLPGCQIIVEKAKVVNKGIASKLSVRIERYGQEDIEVVVSSDGNYTAGMELKNGYAREFETEITALKLGTTHYNICVSGCGECEKVALFAIPAPLTLLPPILTVLLAIVTKQVLLSLSCGVFAAAFLANAYNPVEAFIDTFDNYLVLPFLDPGKSGVIVFCALIGGLIEIMQKSGGADSLTRQISRFTSSPHHAAVVTAVLTLLFSFDDFAGIMISGKSMGPLVAKLGLSVQKFSFIVHMMAVSVASLCPLSSWAGIQIGYIESSFDLVNVEVSGFSYLLQSIPYRFFVVTGLLSTVIYILFDKDIVPMITYEEDNLAKKESPDPENITMKYENDEDEVSEESKVPERWYNAIVPLVVLVAISLLRMYFDGKQVILASGEDIATTFMNCASKCNSINCLIVGTSVSLVLTLVLIPVQRIMGVAKCAEYFVEGVKGMSEPIMILILAWSLGFAMNDIHTSEYIAGALGENMPVKYFPSLVCLIGYAMSYASGSAMGTQGIIFPLIVPVVVHLTSDTEIYVKTIAAAFSSTVFGNLCSPIADTTIASALFTNCPMVDHLKVMSTFCVPIAVLTILFGDLFVGMDLYPYYVSYLILIFIVATVFILFGRYPGRRSLFQVLLDEVRGIRRVKSDSSTESEVNERTALVGGDTI
ncbi:uncharacterized protein HI_1586-like isoform X1 [Bolinopsis microptera]|uniref:uncharacterized protein HI_1586-like isoform X1 n=1 Tax=Bolinopsis microptera TaxID=2820187 RepID=UPI00307AB87B